MAAKKLLNTSKEKAEYWRDDIMGSLYMEKPVDITTFIESDYYLGRSTNGGRLVYPVWKDALKKIFRSDSSIVVVLTGAIGCLGADVGVSLLDGRTLTIPEIIEERAQGKQHWVYSYDVENKCVVPGKVVDALLSGTLVETVDVTLDNGEVIPCTPNHPFLLTTGIYVEAQHLKLGDSLMPLYERNDYRGYKEVCSSDGAWHKVYHLVYDFFFGVPCKGNQRHHSDGNKNNNNPDNLCSVPHKRHTAIHANELNPFKIRPGLAAYAARKSNIVRWGGDGSDEERKHAAERMRKRNESGLASKASKSRWGRVGSKERAAQQLKERNADGLNVRASRTRWSKPGAAERQRKKMQEYWESRRKTVVNHKVVSVIVGKGQNVYDLSIDIHHNFALSSGVFVHNTGKSTISIIGLAYIIYRILCLRDAWTYFNLTSAGQMAVCFFNLTKTLGDSRGYSKLQSFLSNSPWFIQHERAIVKGKEEVTVSFPLFRYVLASPYARGFGSIGEDVVCGLMDEVDSPTESIKQKGRVLKAYEATIRRLESRFVRDNKTLGRLFLVASKQDELSFIETFVAKMKTSGKVMVFDIPLWEAKPKTTFSGVTFPIAVADAYNPPKIIEQTEVETYEKNGFRIINAPVEFREEFVRDLVGSLRDLAGVTVAGLRRRKLFASERFIIDCFVPSWKDPIATHTIVVGLEDEVDFIRYLDLSLIRMPKNIPRYIHCDIAFTNDALGLSMSGVAEWTDSSLEEEDGTFSSRRVPIIETDFIMRIKARDGDRIPIHKMRKFIFDLKAEGFRIKKFTSDLRLASEDTLQIFQKAGIEAEYLSVDKTDDAYVNFQHLVYEKRWRCHRHEMLLFELKNLERDADKGKIDHPEEVTDIEFLGDGSVKEVVLQGSKDVSDSVVGSVQSCVTDMGTPIDTKQIVSIAKKLREGSAADNPGGILLKTNDGKTIEGTVSGGKVANQMRDLFKKLK